MRIVKAVGLLVLVAACSGQVANLGTNDAWRYGP